MPRFVILEEEGTQLLLQLKWCKFYSWCTAERARSGCKHLEKDVTTLKL